MKDIFYWLVEMIIVYPGQCMVLLISGLLFYGYALDPIVYFIKWIWSICSKGRENRQS